MGIFSSRIETTISLDKLIASDNEVDGVVLNIKQTHVDGGYILDVIKDYQIELHFDQEVTL